MRILRVILGAIVALGVVFGAAGMAASTGGGSSGDHVRWNVSKFHQYFEASDDPGNRQVYTGFSPWTLAASPALMEVSAVNGQPHYVNQRQQHGVKNTGEGQGGQDTISDDEVLVLSAGAALAPRQFTGIDNLKLVANAGGAKAVITARSDGQVVGSSTYHIGSKKTVVVDFPKAGDVLSGPFDTIELSSDFGRYGVKGFSPGTKFLLTENIFVLTPGNPVTIPSPDPNQVTGVIEFDPSCQASQLTLAADIEISEGTKIVTVVSVDDTACLYRVRITDTEALADVDSTLVEFVVGGAAVLAELCEPGQPNDTIKACIVDKTVTVHEPLDGLADVVETYLVDTDPRWFS